MADEAQPSSALHLSDGASYRRHGSSPLTAPSSRMALLGNVMMAAFGRSVAPHVMYACFGCLTHRFSGVIRLCVSWPFRLPGPHQISLTSSGQTLGREAGRQQDTHTHTHTERPPRSEPPPERNMGRTSDGGYNTSKCHNVTVPRRQAPAPKHRSAGVSGGRYQVHLLAASSLPDCCWPVIGSLAAQHAASARPGPFRAVGARRRQSQMIPPSCPGVPRYRVVSTCTPGGAVGVADTVGLAL